jgi:hypothetical protein
MSSESTESSEAKSTNYTLPEGYPMLKFPIVSYKRNFTINYEADYVLHFHADKVNGESCTRVILASGYEYICAMTESKFTQLIEPYFFFQFIQNNSNG